jgi:hypothetical protein
MLVQYLQCFQLFKKPPIIIGVGPPNIILAPLLMPCKESKSILVGLTIFIFLKLVRGGGSAARGSKGEFRIIHLVRDKIR